MALTRFFISDHSRSRLIRRLHALLTLLSVIFVVYLVWSLRPELTHILFRIYSLPTLLALVLLLGSNIFTGLLFSELINRRSDTSIDSRFLAGSFLYCQIAKYIPGRIWGIVQQASLLNSRVISPLVVIENIRLTLVTFLFTAIIGLSLIALQLVGISAFLVCLFLGWLAALLVAITPFPQWLNRLLSRADRNTEVPSRWGTSDSQSWGSLGLMLCMVMSSYLIGWLLFFHETLGLSLEKSLQIAAIFSLSAPIGILSMLPAGIGAREAAMLGFGLFLAPTVEVAASAAVVSRVAMLIIDLLSFPLGWLGLRESKN